MKTRSTPPASRSSPGNGFPSYTGITGTITLKAVIPTSSWTLSAIPCRGCSGSCPGIPTRWSTTRPASCPSWKTTRICGFRRPRPSPPRAACPSACVRTGPNCTASSPKPCTRSSLPSGNSSTTAGSAASRRSTFPRARSGPACSALKSSCPSCC